MGTKCNKYSQFYTKHCFHAHNNGIVECIPIDRDRVGKTPILFPLEEYSQTVNKNALK